MGPIGSDLSISQLVEALHWKVNASNDRMCSIERSRIMVTELDDLRARLSDVVAALVVLRNAFCPVNRLPPEMLANIFHEQRAYVPAFRPTEVDHPNPNDLLTVSHVCHHWRQTALCFPSLWSTIRVQGYQGKISNEFLQRSKQAPLRVYYNRINPGRFAVTAVTKLFKTLASQSHRFVECHVSTNHLNMGPLLRSLANPAPALEALSLKIDMPMSDSQDLSLPPIFAGRTPKLRKLALSHYPSWWGNVFKNLTHLSLHHQRRAGRYSMAEFLDILKDSPTLEELALIDGGPRKEHNMTAFELEQHTVTLCHLRKLEIGCWRAPQMVSDFLSCLVLPPSVELCIWEGEPSIRELDNMLSIVFNIGSRHWRNLSGIKMIHVVLHPHSDLRVPASMVISIRGTTMFLRTRLSLGRAFPTSGWFPGQLDDLYLLCNTDVVLWPPTLDDYTRFFRNMLPVTSLTLSGTNLAIVAEAMEVLHGEIVEDPLLSIPAAFWECYPNANKPGATTYQEDFVQWFQRYIPNVQLTSTSPADSVGPNAVWPTAASRW